MRDSSGTTLAGKAAIVTGASREIGAAMAEALAARGAAVLVSHLGEAERAEAVVARIRAEGGSAVAHEADLSDSEAGREMIRRAVRAFGRLDLYAANAGLTHWSPFLEYAEADWDRVVDLNLKGSFFTAQAAARQMAVQGAGGLIVFSASTTGVRTLPNVSAYSVTKAGLIHMARCLALELGPQRISVNALVIGATLNDRNLADDPDYDAHWTGVTPAGRSGRPQDVARALLYLVENPYITGTGLVIDGGWTIASPIPGKD
jgi:3-oxoacyl-[acyl-carrier protein] reductase